MLESKWLLIAACSGLLMAGSQSCVVSESSYDDDGFKAELERLEKELLKYKEKEEKGE